MRAFVGSVVLAAILAVGCGSQASDAPVDVDIEGVETALEGEDDVALLAAAEHSWRRIGEEGRWQDYAKLGRAFERLEDWPRAEQAFEYALERAPELGVPLAELERSRLRLGLARVAAATGDFVTSADQAGRAVRLTPSEPDAYVEAASAHLQLEDMQNARQNVAEALSLDPDHERALGLAQLMAMEDQDPSGD